MNESIRYYADQHYPAPVTEGLLRRGIDILTAQAANKCGADDPDQLAFATARSRVIVTFDSDFLVLHQSGVQHSGIIWCPATKYGIGPLLQLLVLLHGVVDALEMHNHVEYR